MATSKALIIPAAGSGKRMQRKRAKPFIKLDGKTILEYTLRRFFSLDGLKQVIVSSSSDYLEEAETILEKCIPSGVNYTCVEGGSERQHSIYNALGIIKNAELVIVHDAVRPFVSPSHIAECCNEAESMGAAVLGIPCKDTIKRINNDQIVEETPDRKYLWQVQTPQVFKLSLLKKAYSLAAEKDFVGTDDASLVEWMGKPVKMVKGSPRNIKLTYPHDLEVARLQFKRRGQNEK